MNNSKITVLVVEDEPLVRADFADFLQDEGFTVLEATNAQEAVRLLSFNPHVQIVFTDIDMPGHMNGLRLAAAVQGGWPEIQTVITSGRQEVRPTDHNLRAQFVPKPYNQAHLAQQFRAMAA